MTEVVMLIPEEQSSRNTWALEKDKKILEIDVVRSDFANQVYIQGWM